MEERVDRNVHRGPAGVAARPEVPQQASAGRRRALKAPPLPQEQQWPLTPRTGRVLAQMGPEEVHAGCFQPLRWGLLGKGKDQSMDSLLSGVLPPLGRSGTPRCS